MMHGLVRTVTYAESLPPFGINLTLGNARRGVARFSSIGATALLVAALLTGCQGDGSCKIEDPACPLSPLSPANPANPASPLNPINQPRIR